VKTPEQREIEKLTKELSDAKHALRSMYALRGGMEKPQEHRPTFEALRLTEIVLDGYSYLKWEPR
jgi:hypothetical protein